MQQLNYDLKRLYFELTIFLERIDLKEILSKLKGHKIKIYNGKNKLIIHCNESKYIIGIIKRDYNYYWSLKPYNNSSFETKSKLEGNFGMILQAIKDNEELYTKKS